jgi:hypothetical protein
MGINTRHDFRVISVNGDPRTYSARVQSGKHNDQVIDPEESIKYFNSEEVDEKLLSVVTGVDIEFSQFGSRIYSTDMGMGKSGKVWIYEMNGKPTQVWNPNDPISIKFIKERHQAILDAIESGVQNK